MTGTEQAQDFPKDIRRTVRLTQGAMIAERLSRAFWPLGAAAVSVWAAISFGVLEPLGQRQALAGLLVVAVGLLWLAVSGFRKFRWPGRDAALRRLDGTLAGHPLTALQDSIAGRSDDPHVMAVWRAHIERMRRRAAEAKAVPADLRLSGHDPWALRLMALVLFAAALLFARGDAIGSVTESLAPVEAVAGESGPSYEGWAEPPAYTGVPTIYLPEVAGDAALAVPEGTKITLRVYGDSEEFSLSGTLADAVQASLLGAADGIALSELGVGAGGDLSLLRGEDTVGKWVFSVMPDDAPEIDAAGPVERVATGEINLPFTASDAAR